MWIPSDKSRFTSKFTYQEFGKYAPHPKTGKMGVLRDIIWNGEGNQVGTKLYTLSEIDNRRARYDNTGVYVSTFQFDNRDFTRAQGLSSLYFDLDAQEKKGQTIDDSLEETRKLYGILSQHIPDDGIRIYFTGLKGFHVECEAITLGIGPLADLADVFRYIANSLKDDYDFETFDFQVYDPRRMWRLPYSKHQKTGLYKIELTKDEIKTLSCDEIKELAKEPRKVEFPDPDFDPKANEWYREWTYKRHEKAELSAQERIDRFMKFGTGIARDVGEQEFDPVRLFEGCPSIIRLWDKAEKNHHLEHEERLFLCSILTYSDEAVWYLHKILQNCDDYDLVKSDAHIKDWIRRRELGIGGRPYSCARANSAGIGCGDCSLEVKEKYEIIGNRMVPTGQMTEPSPIRFAYSRKKDSHGQSS